MSQGRWRQRGLNVGFALLGALVACGGGSPAARADSSNTSPPVAPSTLFTLQSALKLPDWMQLQVAISGQPMFNPVGGLVNTGAWVQQTSVDLQLNTGLTRDSSQWREFDHWAVNVNGNHTTGNFSYGTEIGAIFPLQSASYPTAFWLTEASLERQAGNGRVNVKGGILPLNPDFMEAPILNFYVHSSLNNTLNIQSNNLPINPYSSVGGVVNLRIQNDLNLRAGLFNLNSVEAFSSFPLASFQGFQPNVGGAGNGTVQFLQLDYTGSGLAPPQSKPIPACSQPWALVRNFPRCQNPTTVANQLPGGLLSVGAFNSNDPQTGDGLYGSLTLRTGLPIGLAERIWVGASYTPNNDVDFAPAFVGGGWVVQGMIPKRPLDVLVLGIGRGALSSEAPPNLTSPYEGMLELGYMIMLNETVQLQPTLQWIINPSGGGDQSVPGILAAGMQINLNF
jgi:porin